MHTPLSVRFTPKSSQSADVYSTAGIDPKRTLAIIIKSLLIHQGFPSQIHYR